MNHEKRQLKILAIVLTAVIILTLAGGVLYILMQQRGSTFLGRTKINGKNVSGFTQAEVLSEMEKDFASCGVRVVENGTEVLTGSLSDFGYTLDVSGMANSVKKAFDLQRDGLGTTLNSILSGSAFRIPLSFQSEEEVFTEKLSAESFSVPRILSRDAYLQYDEDNREYFIVPEVRGNEFPEQDFRQLAREKLEAFLGTEPVKQTLTLEIPAEIYYSPSVTSTDPDLNLKCSVYNQYCRSSVIYQFGSQTETLDWNTVKDWILFEDGEGYLSAEKLDEFVTGLEERYNTRYVPRTFHTSVGTDISFSGSENEYGYTINKEEEIRQLTQDLLSGGEAVREPVYYKTNSYDNPFYYAREGADDLAGTYVEVNLSRQHLWFYVRSALIVESDFVSGSVSRNAETKTGVFPLAYKESPSVLVGENAEDGYRQEVQFWMPFYEGQGLHDASWRSSFGGEIYIYNGSHGCVNLPYQAAETIYNNIAAGMAIVIYK